MLRHLIQPKKRSSSDEIKQDEMIKTTEIRLERMRETVDEKLHKTLEERLGNHLKWSLNNY